MIFNLYGNQKMSVIVKNDSRLKEYVIHEIRTFDVKRYKRKNVNIGLTFETRIFNQSFCIYSNDAKIFDDFTEQIRVIKN